MFSSCPNSLLSIMCQQSNLGLFLCYLSNTVCSFCMNSMIAMFSSCPNSLLSIMCQQSSHGLFLCYLSNTVCSFCTNSMIAMFSSCPNSLLSIMCQQSNHDLFLCYLSNTVCSFCANSMITMFSSSPSSLLSIMCSMFAESSATRNALCAISLCYGVYFVGQYQPCCQCLWVPWCLPHDLYCNSLHDNIFLKIFLVVVHS